jgi:hypothetical protein
LAAKIFGDGYGEVVIMGSIWQFMWLIDRTVILESKEYALDPVEKLLTILPNSKPSTLKTFKTYDLVKPKFWLVYDLIKTSSKNYSGGYIKESFIYQEIFKAGEQQGLQRERAYIVMRPELTQNPTNDVKNYCLVLVAIPGTAL